MEANIIENIIYTETKPQQEFTDEEIDEYFEKQLDIYKIPKQHLQIITIKQQQIPIVTHYTTHDTTYAKGTQGLVQILISSKDTRTLRKIIQECHEVILNEYNKTKQNQLHYRTDQEYLTLINKHINKYTKQLNLDPVKTQHQYLVTNKLGYATKNNKIVFNKYLKYMSEETIQYVVYHELCHIYVYKKYHTLGHGKQFQEIMLKEYTPEDEERIKTK